MLEKWKRKRSGIIVHTNLFRQLEAKDTELEAKDKELEAKDNLRILQLEAKDQELEEKDRARSWSSRQKLGEQMKFIEILLARIRHLEESAKNTTRQLGAHGRLIQKNTERHMVDSTSTTAAPHSSETKEQIDQALRGTGMTISSSTSSNSSTSTTPAAPHSSETNSNSGTSKGKGCVDLDGEAN
jgi:hypothetical protein